MPLNELNAINGAPTPSMRFLTRKKYRAEKDGLDLILEGGEGKFGTREPGRFSNTIQMVAMLNHVR